VPKSIYLINPLADFPSYFSAEVFAAWGFTPASSMADLAIATVAALAAHDFEVRLCDENISPIDFDATVDFVGITGKVSQWGRMKSIAQEFRRRDIPVVMGGPYASLSPDMVRPHCDILVRGEIEDIAPRIFSDLRSGSWQTEYVGTKVNLQASPMPRWDLYPNERALMGTLQTSRGCPFECEFCDVIEYVGRKQRHKPIDLVLRELDELYRHGYRTVFLADDNFTVYRAHAKELLAAIHDWNAKQADGRVRFTTQISIDAAGDTEMLQMCADAGLTHVFIGIETPDEASLREAKKRQNLKRNLLEEIQRIINYGISVDCGMIVGFDNDDVSIFRRQYDFAMATAVPIFSLGALVAPAATPLHARLAKAGRLIENGSEIAATPWSTNVIPKNMTRDELFHGIRWLCNSIYHPAAFEERMLKLIDTLGSIRVPAFARREPQISKVRAVVNDAAHLLQRMRHLGPAEEQMFSNVIRRLRRNREAAGEVLGCMLQYCQVRYMYERCELWDPALGWEADTVWQEPALGTAELTAAS
jgi:radical SAM superfamily enzyme YgiQ (UPF0313 family)